MLYAFRSYNHYSVSISGILGNRFISFFITRMPSEGMVLTPEILRALSPYRQHPSRFGMYELRDREAGPVDYDVQLDLAIHEDMAL